MLADRIRNKHFNPQALQVEQDRRSIHAVADGAPQGPNAVSIQNVLDNGNYTVTSN